MNSRNPHGTDNASDDTTQSCGGQRNRTEPTREIDGRNMKPARCGLDWPGIWFWRRSGLGAQINVGG